MTVDTSCTSLITVDTATPFRAMIAAGKYDWVNSGDSALGRCKHRICLYCSKAQS